MALWLAGIAYCNQQRTDGGVIPAVAVARLLAPSRMVDPGEADALVAAGLWAAAWMGSPFMTTGTTSQRGRSSTNGGASIASRSARPARLRGVSTVDTLWSPHRVHTMSGIGTGMMMIS